MKKHLKRLTLGLVVIISSLLLVVCIAVNIARNNKPSNQTIKESYLVTFDSGNGHAPITREIKHGNTTSNIDVSRDGHIFQGWYLDSELFDFDTPITADITLQAKWAVDISGMCEYRLATDGKSYEITKYNGNGVSELVLPSEYNGLPVTCIGFEAFSFCKNLTSITIPDGVTSINFQAFNRCDSLTSIIIPESVTYIDHGAFRGCGSLTSITIPDGVTSIGDRAFYYCTNLTSITIPDSVTSIGREAFLCCTNLTSIIIPDSVTSIGGSAFSDCSRLTSITLPDSVTSIGGHAFAYCTNLTSIIIPDSVISIGGHAFEYCINLTSIIIPDSVTSIERSVFYGWNSNQTIYFKAETEPQSWLDDGYLYYCSARVVWGYKE